MDKFNISLQEFFEYFDLNAFLQQYNNILFEEHAEEIVECYNFLKVYKKKKILTSSEGEHYELCCWAYDTTTSGPETCDCWHVRQKYKSLVKLLKMYKRLRTYILD